MLIIGLTGNIGSGKSTVARYLAAKGAVVIDTDEISRKLVEPGQPALAEIVKIFGREILNSDGTLNRSALARLVFTNDKARRQLEAILHPRIHQHIVTTLQNLKNSSYPPPAVVIEAPLLVEAGMLDLVDEVWLVTAAEETLIQRTAERSGISTAEARARLQSQLPQEIKKQYATRIINNNTSLTETYRQVDRLWEEVIRATGQ